MVVESERGPLDMVQDFLNDVRISDISNNTHGASAERALSDIDIKDSFESLCPAQRSD